MSRACVVLGLLVLLLASGLAQAVESLGELLGRARVARDAGQLEQAVQAYDAMLAQVPSHETALLERAQTLSWDGNYQQALEGYRQFKALFPKRALDADLRIAQVQAWSGDNAGAAQTLAPWVVEGQSRAVLDDATYRAWDGHLGESIQRLDRWLAEHPNDRDALLAKARFRSWTGDLAAAERDYQAVLTAFPDDQDAGIGLARLAIWRGDPVLSRQRLSSCGQPCQASAEGKLLKAQLDGAEGRLRESVKTLRQLAKGGAAQRDAREILFDDISARGTWVEMRHQRTDTNEGLRTERPVLRARLPWLDGYAQVEAAERFASFAGDRRRSEQLGVALRQPLGERWRLAAGLLHDQDFGGKSASAWNAGLGVRLAPGWQWELSVARQLLDFTPAAIDRRGAIRALDSGLGFTTDDGLTALNLGLGKAWLSAGSERRSFFLSAVRKLPVAAVDWRVGLTARGFGYSDTLDLGFFNPERYRFLGATSSTTWRSARRYEVRLNLQAGRQRVNNDDSQFTWGYGLAIERHLFDGGWTLFAEWNASRAGLPVAQAGDPADYSEHTLGLGLRWRQRP